MLRLKADQTDLFDDVKAYFEDALSRGFGNRPVSHCESRDYEHGRYEVRRYHVSPEVEWLIGRDGEDDWEGL